MKLRTMQARNNNENYEIFVQKKNMFDPSTYSASIKKMFHPSTSSANIKKNQIKIFIFFSSRMKMKC